MQEKFSYSSQPHAAPVKRKSKYRDSDDVDGGGSFSMMNDPRVVRGNTYAAKVMTTSLKQEQNMAQKQSAHRVRQDASKRRTAESNRAGTPPPVPGRSHMNMQTENFLEELTDKPIDQDAETQTQALMDRPVSPLFVASKTGRDVYTQIDVGDLFDFDLEVEPILEVLVGKTIHISMLELMQEEELDAIRREQEEFEAIRNIELAEVQRLEAEGRRNMQEKERRLVQEKKRVKDRAELEEKIAARAFSSQYLSSMHVGVMDDLFQDGFFYDPVKKEIEENVMVELLAGLKDRVDSYNVAQALVDELMQEAGVMARSYQSRAEAARERKRVELQREAEAEAKRKAEEEAKKAAEEAAAAAAAAEAGEEE
ncbi:RSP3 [Symbiodinium microadriaticum]|nr:RSP3 [Symbiodinium microadriaticum]